MAPMIAAKRPYRYAGLPASVFADHPAPQRIALAAKRFIADAGGFGRARDYQDKLEFGIDEDRLAVDTEQGKPALFDAGFAGSPDKRQRRRRVLERGVRRDPVEAAERANSDAFFTVPVGARADRIPRGLAQQFFVGSGSRGKRQRQKAPHSGSVILYTSPSPRDGLLSRM